MALRVPITGFLPQKASSEYITYMYGVADNHKGGKSRSWLSLYLPDRDKENDTNLFHFLS